MADLRHIWILAIVPALYLIVGIILIVVQKLILYPARFMNFGRKIYPFRRVSTSAKRLLTLRPSRETEGLPHNALPLSEGSFLGSVVLEGLVAEDGARLSCTIHEGIVPNRKITVILLHGNACK